MTTDNIQRLQWAVEIRWELADEAEARGFYLDCSATDGCEWQVFDGRDLVRLRYWPATGHYCQPGESMRCIGDPWSALDLATERKR